MVLFDADYPYPKVYSDFCYQKSIQSSISSKTPDRMAWIDLIAKVRIDLRIRIICIK